MEKVYVCSEMDELMKVLFFLWLATAFSGLCKKNIAGRE